MRTLIQTDGKPTIVDPVDRSDKPLPEPPVFAVDFDGTCVENVWPDMGDWLPGAVDGLKALDELGTVVIHSCRVASVNIDGSPRTESETYQAKFEVQDKLKEAGLGHLEVWTRPYKPPAMVYIDDRALQFNPAGLQSWDWVLNQVRRELDVGVAPCDDPRCACEDGDDCAFPTVVAEITEASDSFVKAIENYTQGLSIRTFETGSGVVRTFETGATRDTDEGKLDFEGFLSPLVLTRFAEYMHEHRLQSDGTLRSSDNWQKGIPIDQYMKSMFRHFMELWITHRDEPQENTQEILEDALCALLFNVQGYLHEIVRPS